LSFELGHTEKNLEDIVSVGLKQQIRDFQYVISAFDVLNPSILMIYESLHVFVEVAMSILLTQAFY